MSIPHTRKKHKRRNSNKTVLDMLWQLFASVRFAIVIIVLIALSSTIGTLIPQEDMIPSNDPSTFYASRYGAWGTIMYQLGFTKLYVSWWFLTLLLLLAASLIICSIERIVPLYKSLKHQVIRKSTRWIQQRKLYVSFESESDAYENVKLELTKRRYSVRQDQDSYLAEKGRFARFGPYIIHIGLLIIIAGAFSRLIPGWYLNDNVMIQEGETKAIAYTDFSVRNNKFTIQYYEDGRPSMYETDATIVKQHTDIKHASIQVNHALQYNQVTLYQQSFGDPIFKTATLQLTKPTNNDQIGAFQVDFANVQPKYQVGNYTVSVKQYYPNFTIKNNQPDTDGNDAYKPVFLFEVTGPGITTPKSQAFFAFFPILSNLQKDNPVQFAIQDITKTQATVLRVHKDLGIPIVYGGTGVVMFGLVLTFYFQHRRVWVRQVDGMVHIGGHTNKNWYAFRKEFESVLHKQSVVPVNIGREGGSGRV